MKKVYERPTLKVQGSLEDLTLGSGLAGNDDQFLWFSWGEDEDVS